MPENKAKRAARQKKYNARPDQKAKRAARGRARYKVAKNKGVSPTALKGDVHHKNGNPRDNSPKNISLTSVKKNRGTGNNKGKKRVRKTKGATTRGRRTTR